MPFIDLFIFTLVICEDWRSATIYGRFMGRFSGEFRVSYFPLIDRVNGVIIYMQTFRHAHWLRARQLIPNIAENCARRVTSLGRTICNSL